MRCFPVPCEVDRKKRWEDSGKRLFWHRCCGQRMAYVKLRIDEKCKACREEGTWTLGAYAVCEKCNSRSSLDPL